MSVHTIPENLAEAVELLAAQLEIAERFALMQLTPGRACEGWDRIVHPDWQLDDRRSPLTRWFVRHCGLAHPDDLHCLIMEALWAKLHGVTPLTRELSAIARYRWRAQDRDPLWWDTSQYFYSDQPPPTLPKFIAPDGEPEPVASESDVDSFADDVAVG